MVWFHGSVRPSLNTTSHSIVSWCGLFSYWWSRQKPHPLLNTQLYTPLVLCGLWSLKSKWFQDTVVCVGAMDQSLVRMNFHFIYNYSTWSWTFSGRDIFLTMFSTLNVICFADNPTSGSCFCGGSHCAVLCPASRYRWDEEEAAGHPAGPYG